MLTTLDTRVMLGETVGGVLLAGMAVAGPAIVTQSDCTILVPPAWWAEVDGLRNLVLQREGPASAGEQI